MKMTPDHFNRLASAVKQVISECPDDLQEHKDHGWSMTRYRWTLFNKVCDRDRYELARELWQYCNDDHIDSALRKITNTQ